MPYLMFTTHLESPRLILKHEATLTEGQQKEPKNTNETVNLLSHVIAIYGPNIFVKYITPLRI